MGGQGGLWELSDNSLISMDRSPIHRKTRSLESEQTTCLATPLMDQLRTPEPLMLRFLEDRQ